MDKKEAIAIFVEQAAKHYAREPIAVELIDGPSKGTRLQGCVSWAGDGWRVVMNRNSNDWQFFKHLWHEVGHIHYGDTPKVVDTSGYLDRPTIAGVKNAATAARLDAFLESDSVKEARADQFALDQARRWLPGLNEYLSEIKYILEEPVPEVLADLRKMAQEGKIPWATVEKYARKGQ